MLRRVFSPSRSTREGGQVLVIFALALVAIVSMTGLVLDGGSAFVKRRDMQNVADSAAMAAGYAYAMGGDATAATNAARAITAANGYVHGTNGVTVNVVMTTNGPARNFAVTLTGTHRNNFSGIVGMPTWPITTTATAIAGKPTGVIGAMPIIFNIDAFEANGTGPDNVVSYSEPAPGSEDVPVTTTSFNWTMYCDDCNADSSTVSTLIVAGGEDDVVSIADTISPLNAGSHATLYSDLAEFGVGGEFPVPMVDNDGNMVGWAMFHVTGSVGGSTKQISGYFVSPVNPSAMRIITTLGEGCDCGAYKVYLIN
jgi:hypothetical protein